MDTSFHYLLLAAQGMFQRRILARLAGSGLTAGQPKVLNYLGLHNGSVQKSIALGCQIDPATLTGLLGRMEEKGLVERRAEGGDRRALHVYLTDFGWRSSGRCCGCWRRAAGGCSPGCAGRCPSC